MKNQDSLLLISSSPHMHSPDSVPSAMRDVILALLPALLAALYYFRVSAAFVILACVITAFLSEAAAQKIMKREITVYDYSAAVTGLLLAFCLPPSTPWWIAAIGAIVSIVIGKQFFGGLGSNIFNPALIGRAFLLASWPVALTKWSLPVDSITAVTASGSIVDSVTTATPLGIIKEAGLEAALPPLSDMFWGNIGGSIGETCAPALILGGLYLLYRGHIDWRIPFSYLGTVFAAMSIAGMINGQGMWYPVFHLLAGGLLLGAFFMATDWVTSPITKKGRIIFGIGCGLLTVLIRLKGGYPEGVCYSILLMNTITPLIDRYTKDRVFGRVKRHA